jgi:hypothetical protein
MSSRPEAVMIVEATGNMLRETLDIPAWVQRNPYGMVAGAVGMGFVLGGGLFTRLTARILGVGLRIVLVAALPILQEGLVGAVTGSKLTIKRESDQ